ncbi:hypothetical protein EYF80_059937 [Liparis tanakae]|uniref:Uncharacterized protein n=1 Tax=Liparis tanakae TaxID=230148 RepID=A0A4Z2EMX0_9TELE|nr:hypothetical protein EYF80_059937 [Liparis tanakae]
MGSSMGCVSPPREGDHAGAPRSSRKRLRFRRKKSKKAKRGEEERGERRRGEEEEEEEEEGKAVVDAAHSSNRAVTPPPAPDVQLTRSNTKLPGDSLSPGSLSASGRSLRFLEVSPKPSPAWRGVFCLPGEEDSVSGTVDVSSLPSQTATASPAGATPGAGGATPGGGRVCRVKEKVQGLLEKPRVLLQEAETRDEARAEPEGRRGGEAERTPSGGERRGVVHIREVGGKLCVVRTVYPRDYGSPVWRGDGGGGGGEVEVRAEPLAPSPVAGSVLRVQLWEEEAGPSGGGASRPPPSLLESGYASDLPLTSPETGGTTPTGGGWGGLTGGSSDSMEESPTVRRLTQV